MNKDKKYKIIRSFGLPCFKLYYHPNIIGKENIPVNGPLVICGNYLNILDQIPVMCSTKRIIHWMRKKDDFQGKYGKIMDEIGTIWIDEHNNYLEEAMEYLRNGEVVGVFPEGIRNSYRLTQLRIMRLEKKLLEIHNMKYLSGTDCMNMTYFTQKEINEEIKKLEIIKQRLLSNGIQVVDKDILLPFKDDAVRIAKETDASIVPFSVTGSYVKNSNDLVVRFDSAFKVDNIEKANKNLRNKVKQLIIKNY